MDPVHIWTLVLAVVLYCWLSYYLAHASYKKGEGFVQSGHCDCCNCGWIDCRECDKRSGECCANRFAYDRYTFTGHTWDGAPASIGPGA